jgi:hypothetical protein
LECLLYGVYKVLVPSKDGESKIITSRHATFDEEELPGLKAMADTMDGDGASDSSYACKSIDSSDSDSESEYFDASSEHSSYSDYSSDCGPEKLVEPIAEDLDEEAPDSDAEEGTPISEEASEKTNKFERFPGLSRTRNKPRSFWAKGTQNESRTDIKITTSDSPTLREALSSTPIEQQLWKQSIAEEMESLQAKGTWVDVAVATCPPLPTHPDLQIKRTVNGEFERCKTRIVAGGDHQEYGVNYTDTYAPVIEWTIVRL